MDTNGTGQGALASVVTMLATKGLTVLATAMATNGIINASATQTVVAAGLFVLSIGVSLWREYLKTIVMSQLEVLKAKSLAQAEKMRKNSIAPVTVTEIANKSPTMEPADVAKAALTLPPDIQSNIKGLDKAA